MAWNGSSSAGASVPAPKKPAKKSPGLAHGLIAGAAIVLVGIISLYFVTGESDEPTVEKKAPTQIADVEPDIAAPKTNVVAVAKPQTPEDRRLAQLKYFRDKYGDNIPDNLKGTVYFLEHPPKVDYKHKGQNDYLRHSSERMIAAVVLTEPGTKFIIPPTVDRTFDRDFLNSLLDKIDVNDDDSEEVRNVKNDVEAIKKEIAAACKEQGKTPSEIFNEHAKAMYELGQFKENLDAEISKITDNPDFSDEDVDDAVAAANKMLEDRGLAPMPLPNLARRSIRLKFLAKRRVLQQGVNDEP